MANAKKSIITKLSGIVIFTYLAIFPLGQLIRLNFDLFGNQIALHPVDIVAGSALILLVFGKVGKPKVFRFILGFLAVSLFSLLFSLTFYNSSKVLVGAFYLLRLSAYAGFFAIVWNYSDTMKLKATLLNALILVSLLTAIFGWIQYFWAPDLRDLKFLGWDDHLFRLTGTFFDPAFTSIIIVLGFLVTFGKIAESNKKKLIPIGLVLIVSLAFTYARAAYLALVGGLAVFIILKKKAKLIFWPVILLLLLLPFLPRPAGEGVRLERVQSAINKIENYQETIEFFQQSPLLGLGFNNLCTARLKYLGAQDSISHSCSGSDSSILLVVATTGTVGLLIFINMAIGLIRSTGDGIYGTIFKSCCGALFVHSLFVNSLFYPWIMGWMGILLAISQQEKLGRKMKS